MFRTDGDDMFSKEKFKQRFTAILSLDAHPRHIAAGFAVGVFISFIPPVPGLHTSLALCLAFLLRLNKVACLAGTMVNTYLTTIPTMIASYKIGAFLLGLPLEWNIEHLNWEHLKDILVRDSKPLLLGCAILGFVAAVIAYFVLYFLVISFCSKNAAKREMPQEELDDLE